MTTAERLDAMSRDVSEGGHLTRRQRDVLGLVAAGLTDREIGVQLLITGLAALLVSAVAAGVRQP